MKRAFLFVVSIVALGLFFTGCGKDTNPFNVDLEDSLTRKVVPGDPGDNPAICGEPIEVILYSGRHINVGSVKVWNDENNLYVQYTTIDGWMMKKTHLSVAVSLDGIPQKKGNPRPRKFPYKRKYNKPITEDTYVIPLSWSAGTKLYLAAHAILAKHKKKHCFKKIKSVWGDGYDFPGKTKATYFTFDIQDCLTLSDFRTQTMDDWSEICNNHNSGCYCDANFVSCFPSGLRIGSSDRYTILLTSSQSVKNFLPQTGTPRALRQSYIDPVQADELGSLAGQLAAVTLNVYFDLCDQNFGKSEYHLIDQLVADPASPFYGWAMGEVLWQANRVLGGERTSYTPAQMSECLTRINENYRDGTTDNGFLIFP
ncbi:MAG: hypothetical protein JW827_00950 [Spirochaetes bacterium]|nr:hypothetical protein [Spirochaetota bacterium]